MQSTTIDDLMPEREQNVERRFIRIREVLRRTGFCRSSLYAAVKAGSFPPPVQIGARAVAWDTVAVSGWMAERISEAHRATSGARP